ncbi:MAG TPA: hypothetical protein DD640_09250 [Clostridiales bacterium]|nr:hypothetical protein [Clostridiales bacterium]
MARTGRQRYIRIRKRLFVVTGLILLAVILVGALIAYYAASLVGQDDLTLLTLSEGQSRTAVMGSGISLDQAKSSNLVQEGSFELLVFRQTLTVYSGDDTTLTISSQEASAGQYGDGFFDQASARVMTQTDQGLALKKTAQVVSYGINRVGVFQAVNLPGDTPEGLAILDFGRNDNLSLAVGQQGLMISNVTGQMPENIDSGLDADLTGICSTGEGFLVCSNRGNLLYTSDGQSIQTWSTPAALPLRAIAAADSGLFVSVGDDGTLITGKIGTAHQINLPVQADLNDISYGLSTFVAIGSEGTILVSRTGLIWKSIQVAGLTDLTEPVNWQAIDFRDSRFVMAGSGGAIAISDDGVNFHLLGSNGQTDSIDLVMLSRQQLIILDDAGHFYISNDSGANWQQSAINTGMTSRVIALTGKDKIISADEAGNLGLAQLVAEIRLDSPLKEGQYQAGDLIYLEKTSASVPESYLAADPSQAAYQSPWEVYGSGTKQSVNDTVSPGGGTASLLLQSQSGGAGQEQAAILSQVIDASLIDQISRNEVYRVELWMKQSDVDERQAQVWLTGPFRTVGTTFTNVGSTWKKYSFNFIIPTITGSLESHEVRINIAIGSGSLWLDQISLCRANDQASLLASSFQSEIDAIEPQVIRLGFAAIGSPTVRQDGWASALGNENPHLSDQGWTSQTSGTLNSALQLTHSAGADPWLVIDSYTSEATILNLIEFLAGPISEPYGKIRQELGEVVPWFDQFDRILIEFCDTSGVLGNDRLKADFANLMIQTISDSPYYRQIKSKVVFVDGMDYNDGVVLSTADYHASDLNNLILPDSSQAIQRAFLEYYDQIPRNPEKPSENWPELMRSAQLRPNGTNLPNLADLTEILLRDLGKQSSLSNLYLPRRDSQDWQPSWPVAARIASAGAQGVPLVISGATAAVQAYGFRSEERTAIVITNLSEETANCRLLTDIDLRDGRIFKYDANGNLLRQQTLRKSGSRQTLLPGGVILIIKENEPAGK